MAMYLAQKPKSADVVAGNSGPTFAAREPDAFVDPPTLGEDTEAGIDFETLQPVDGF